MRIGVRSAPYAKLPLIQEEEINALTDTVGTIDIQASRPF